MEKENELQSEVIALQKRVTEIEVRDEGSYRLAVDTVKRIKELGKMIESFFEPMKKSAHSAWKAVCDKENEFKKPLDIAEKAIKGSMSKYQAEQDAIQRKAEEEFNRQRIADMQEKLKQGKINEIVPVEPMPVVASVPKVEGVQYRTDYNVWVYDEDQVPCSVNGVMIRPVDIAEVKRLAIANKGDLKIPGIAIEIVKNPVIR